MIRIMTRLARVSAPLALAVFAIAGQPCLGHAQTEPEGKGASTGKAKYYCGKGEVISVDLENASVTIKHERIEGFMEAMRMKMKAESPDVLEDVQAGSQVRFTLRSEPGKLRVIYIEEIGSQ